MGRTEFPYIHTDGVELTPWFAQAFCYLFRKAYAPASENYWRVNLLQFSSCWHICTEFISIFRTPLLLLMLLLKNLVYCRITLVLIDLHWLPVCRRIDFKIATTVFKLLNYQLCSTAFLPRWSSHKIHTITIASIFCFHYLLFPLPAL